MRYFILMATALALVGCDTTGDPSAGGLYMWSERKANERLDYLESRERRTSGWVQDSREELRSEKDRNALMLAELKAVRAEIRSLDAQLVTLIRRKERTTSYLKDLINDAHRVRGEIRHAESRKQDIDLLEALKSETIRYERAVHEIERYFIRHNSDT